MHWAHALKNTMLKGSFTFAFHIPHQSHSPMTVSTLKIPSLTSEIENETRYWVLMKMVHRDQTRYIQKTE